jgi:hypothetical protein
MTSSVVFIFLLVIITVYGCHAGRTWAQLGVQRMIGRIGNGNYHRNSLAKVVADEKLMVVRRNTGTRMVRQQMIHTDSPFGSINS